MPEGDTLFRTAAGLRKALLGKAVTHFETTVEQVAAVSQRNPVVGRVVTAVDARGKHLLITLTPQELGAGSWGPDASNRKHEDTKTRRHEETQVPQMPQGTEGAQRPRSPIPNSQFPIPNSQFPIPNSQFPIPSSQLPTPSPQSPPARVLVLHTHLRMTGSWHVYRPGEKWWKPRRLAVVVLHTEDLVVPCFSAPVVELLTEWQAARHPDLTGLGPDVMAEDFDPERARRRLRARPDLEIAVALLNQRLMAGVGNVYKSEVLFLRRVWPFAQVADLDEETLAGLVEESHRLMRLNQTRGERRTHFGLRERSRLWVYGREGEPCRVCGSPIRILPQGWDARLTWYCEQCQTTGRK